jgi:hypothetical protein
MDDPRQSTTEVGRETGESRATDRQSLDDATLEPRAYIEQTGDIQQAEAVQTTLVALIDTAVSSREVGATPLPIPHTAQDVGATPLPIPHTAQDVGATPLPIPRPEEKSVLGSLPGVRGDLDKITAGVNDGRSDATPIPLPGKEGPASATPITLPQMRVQPEEEEEGHPPEPPDLDHNPHPEAMMKDPESGTLQSRMPKIRGDLNQATVVGGNAPGGDEATPINLPGPQSSAANKESGFVSSAHAAHTVGDSGGGPGGNKVAAEDDWEAPNADNPAGNPEPGFIKGSSEPAEFEKPILFKEMEDLDSGLGKLDDIDALTPGPGTISGAPGEKTPERGILGGMPGLEGFKGGPSDLLKNNDGMGPEKGHEIPGWDSPFLPGKGPNQWADTSAGGGKKHASSGQGKKGQSNTGNKVTFSGVRVGKDGTINTIAKKGTPSGVGCDATAQRAWEMGEQRDSGETGFIKVECGNGTTITVTWNPQEGLSSVKYGNLGGKKSTDPDIGRGKDTSKPLSSQMAYDRMNPKFDSGHVSNYPEDHIAGGQGGGVMKEEQLKAVKRTLENKAKLAHATPKVGAEQITDPPEPAPGKKSESTGKGG